MNKNIFSGNAWLYAILLCLIGGLQACSDETIDETNKAHWLKVLPLDLAFEAVGGTESILLILTDDINIEDVSFKTSANGADWCSLEREDDNLLVTTAPNYAETMRSTIVTIEYGNYYRQVPVSQSGAKGDQQIGVVSAKATTEETVKAELGIVNSFDGDPNTYFNSKYGAISDWPFQIEYTLEEGYTLDRIVYHPRNSGNKWGSFNQFEVWVSTADAPDTFEKVETFERGDGNHSVFSIKLETPVDNVAKVRFDIYSAYYNRVSCAEMEFFQDGGLKFDYSTIFADDICSVLKEGVTEKEIRAIPNEIYKGLALDLLVDEYKTEFRAALYRPYQNPSVLQKINKTSPYSLRDNPTGIFVDEGDDLCVIVGDTKGQSINMIVQDLNVGFNNAVQYPLHEGENMLTMTSGGLVYIQNLTSDAIPLELKTDADKAAAEAKTVGVHFVMGKVNGYFDSQQHTQDDWTRILANATYQDIDVVGKYAHITWTTKDFVSANTDIVTVLEKYDRLVYLQQEFAGLVKYNKMFNNRMYFHIDYNGASPYATSYRTAYTSRYAEIFCNAARFEVRLWGPAHEVGHVNQLRPSLKWAGTTEVTNNLMSLFVQTEFGVKCKLLADGTYATAKARIIDAGLPHCLDNESKDFMNRVVPFWQLKLYMVDALGKQDFYRDLYEHYRVADNLSTSATTEGILQLDFVRQVCRVSGLNMVDFFQKWGFLTPVDKTLKDYSVKKFTITQEQIDELVAEINAAGYDMPHQDVHLIQDDTVDQFKK